ncbi:hypothetical protein [Treponema primitia]|uniref:hypothetical protein n=1 Tax=Treponema primitia TaxID=88058 RepID=UPI00025550C0|nr:hypothetical protein [Treponema primitia]
MNTVFAGFFVSLLVISCGSQPTVVDPPQDQREPLKGVEIDYDREPPDQAALEALRSALSRVELSRKQALDIDAPGYFPPEWEAAEGQYASAKGNAKDGTLGDVKNTIALYEAAAESYDTAARRCLPLYYQDLSEEILQARSEAIDAGIRGLSPDRLEAADLLIDEALAFYEAGESANAGAENYYAAAELAFGALDRYYALSMGIRAYRIREEIEERDFAQYDSGNYDRADGSMRNGLAAYDSGDTEKAVGEAEEAFLRYTLVINKGWLSFAGDLQVSAETARRKALNAKANVAVRQEFSDADGVYTRGTVAYNDQDYAGASEHFSQVIPLFLTAARNAELKRVVAEDAISTAETRISKSEETAREAEIVLQGGVQ